MRLAAWNLINGELRPTFMQEHGARMRARLSLAEIDNTVALWSQLAIWLDDRGISSLADCSTGVLHDRGIELRDSGRKRKRVFKTLAHADATVGIRPAQRASERHRAASLGRAGRR